MTQIENQDDDRRLFQRKDMQVIVNFFCEGHEKVFESVTKDISCAGIFIESQEDVLKMLNIGMSLVILLEYKPNLLLRAKGYIVRIEKKGFGFKFLELDDVQESILKSL